MICKNCGNIIEDGAAFCPSCGKKIEDMQNTERKSSAVSDVFSRSTSGYRPPTTVAAPPPSAIPREEFAPKPEPKPAPAPEKSAAAAPDRSLASEQARAAFEQASAKPQEPAAAPTSLKPEKEFFGRGAFILCLVVIALLAGSTGAFAYLYFALLGAV